MTSSLSSTTPTALPPCAPRSKRCPMHAKPCPSSGTSSDPDLTALVQPDDPLRDDVRRLLDTHLRFAYTQSPPEDVYALDAEALVADDITFFSIREDGHLRAVGALRELDRMHVELKSMHTAAAARGRGLGTTMLEHLLRVARERGYHRVSLETGTTDAFDPARRLYESVGFAKCEPFGDYRASPYSVCMTLSLD